MCVCLYIYIYIYKIEIYIYIYKHKPLFLKTKGKMFTTEKQSCENRVCLEGGCVCAMLLFSGYLMEHVPCTL